MELKSRIESSVIFFKGRTKQYSIHNQCFHTYKLTHTPILYMCALELKLVVKRWYIICGAVWRFISRFWEVHFVFLFLFSRILGRFSVLYKKLGSTYTCTWHVLLSPLPLKEFQYFNHLPKTVQSWAYRPACLKNYSWYAQLGLPKACYCWCICPKSKLTFFHVVFLSSLWGGGGGGI